QLITLVLSEYGSKLQLSSAAVGEHFLLALKNYHHLDRLNPHHLWLLQELFLDLINTDWDAFKDYWNNHPMSSTNNRSPLASDMRFLSNAKHGTMASEYDHIHPDTLQRYYSTHGSIVHHAGLTGAGHPPDEEDSDMDDDSQSLPAADTYTDSSVSDSEVGDEDENHDTLQDQLAIDVQANINHPAIRVPRSQPPFSNPLHEAIFFAALDQARGMGLIPDGYGVIAAEWEDGYQEYETIRVGRRAQELVVELPESIWYSHAVVWSQGLHIMQTLLYQLEDI
ncbi:hypothetical protein JB92DRAFT_3230669, partial [Gautieria morchelliformis]